MSTSFSTMVTLLSGDLRDPANKTFDTTMIGELLNEAVFEVNTIAPGEFQTDITPTSNTLAYAVGTSDRLTSLRRVEIWDGSVTPHVQRYYLAPLSGEYTSESQAGWYMWNGQLYLPNAVVNAIRVGTDLIRVWGYAPYALVSGSTAMPQPQDLLYAIRAYARLLGKKQLHAARDLFTQWQFASNNTDITPAQLLAEIGQAEASWERQRKHLLVIREAS